MTRTPSIVRRQTNGGGTYDAYDFFYSSSAGAEFINYRLIGTVSNPQNSVHSFADPARLQDDRQTFNNADESSTAGSVDTYMGTVWSSVGKTDLGLAATITPNVGSYNPTGSGAAPTNPAITLIDWSVFDTLTEDDNDLNDAVLNGPVAKTAPYHIARILALPGTAGNFEFRALDTLSNGQPATFLFSFSPDPTPPEVVDYVVGPAYNTDEPGEPQTLNHQFQAAEEGSTAGPFAWDMLTLQSYTPNYGAQYDFPPPTGPYTAPTLTSGGLFTWISEHSPYGDYVWQVRATNQVGISDFGTITVHANPIALMGDYNLDTIVDASDFVLWRKQVGYVVPRCSGADSNCNGFVEVLDYGPWQENYGKTLAAGAASTTNSNVPEACSMMPLAVVALVAIGIRFRL